MLVLLVLSGCVLDSKNALVLAPVETPILNTPDDAEAGDWATAPAVCQRLRVMNALEVDVEWDGDLESCDPGSSPEILTHRALSQLNFARELAGHPSVEARPGELAQSCALLMHANETLSHEPTSDWDCYDEAAAASASESLLASAPGVSAVRGYLVDPGNDWTLGHRRWLLSPWVSEVSFGTTNQYSCVFLDSYDTTIKDPWTAWPPPGQVPRGILESYGFSVDEVGWSLQSDQIDLSAAQVTITHEGVDFPMEVIQLTPWMGSEFGIRFVPDVLIGRTGVFEVHVDGVDEPFDYEVEIVDCPSE